jgi:uncharacterized protein YjbJ (UPF0337 family)
MATRWVPASSRRWAAGQVRLVGTGPSSYRRRGAGSARRPVRKESERPHVPRVLYPISKWRTNVDREHVKGAADKAKGAIKDAVGKLTDDKKLQTEGKIDKAKGAAHNVAGDVKDAVKHATDD